MRRTRPLAVGIPGCADAPGDLPRPYVPSLARSALFADLDGTLAPIEQTPDAVGPSAARAELLAALHLALGGRLAVVSGRSLADLDRVLDGKVPSLAAIHGVIRRRADGAVIGPTGDHAIRTAAAALSQFAGADERLIVEDKGVAVALHYRRAPEAAADCLAAARELCERLHLALQEGDMVAELHPPGANKGAAVAAFMREAPFRGFSPIFLGDDLTDEAGFVVAQRMGGMGVVVGDRRPTAARYALVDVADAGRWLVEALSAS